ncbi:MAG: hypothetical protein JWM16_480 [Verrucomicrobiales bacterium]|nr:hypothetical protein [Verrucomicrobiales bacterium]
MSNLKQVGLATRMFSNDHQDKFPWAVPKSRGGSLEYAGSTEVFRHFFAISNELTSPKVLCCPRDLERPKQSEWNRVSNSNVSYFVGLDADESQPQAILSGDRSLSTTSRPWSGVMIVTKKSPPRVLPFLHNNRIIIGFGDGSVQQMTESEVRNWLLHTNNPPVRLALP